MLTERDTDARRRVDEGHAYLDRNLNRRQVNKVLHGHPSPLLWKEKRPPVREIMRERWEDRRLIPKKLNVYVATPFCLRTNPAGCGYCLFPHEDYRGQAPLVRYLEYLRKEGLMYRHFFKDDEIASIYFGGGTANLYTPENFRKLMGIVREMLPPVSADTEITLEGVPQLFTREKLQAAAALGVNRVSVGVQQLDDDLIALSGRRQTSAQVFRAIDWCRELGLRVSVDLIFGWPRQTLDRMLSDLERMADAGVTHITHYELNVAGRTDFARNRRDELPSIEQNREMFHAAARFLQGRGFRRETTYDWERVVPDAGGDFAFERNMRNPFACDRRGRVTGTDMWGWGFAGVTYLLGHPDSPGCALMNHCRLDDYAAALDAGRFPIERGFMYTPEDLRMTWLFQALQSVEVSLDDYRVIFGEDGFAEHERAWTALFERGWAERTAGGIRLTGDGVYYTPLIQGLLGLERSAELRGGARPVLVGSSQGAA